MKKTERFLASIAIVISFIFITACGDGSDNSGDGDTKTSGGGKSFYCGHKSHKRYYYFP